MPTTANPVANRIWNIPNIITLMRVALILPFTWFMYQELDAPGSGNLWAFALFVTASVTDWFDGMLARKWNLITPLGQLLDPLADKLLVASALVMLSVFDGRYGGVIGVLPWIAIVIIGRELAVTGLRGMAGAEGVVINASSGGKWKTVIQMLALGGLILQGTVEGAAIIGHIAGIPIDLGLWAHYLLYLAVALTAWSGAVYFYRFLRAFT
jgi:CDP-diacylglycerol---glycerol-3-phosphate 3-phosphatidyltransferase